MNIERNEFFNVVFPINKKIHGFGVFGIDLIKNYKWKSIDSTTPAKHAIVGDFYMPNMGWINMNMNQNKRYASWRTSEGIDTVVNYVEKLGFNYGSLCEFDQLSAIKRFVLTVMYFNNFDKKEHKVKGSLF